MKAASAAVTAFLPRTSFQPTHALEERLYSPACMKHMKTFQPSGGGRQSDLATLNPSNISGARTLNRVGDAHIELATTIPQRRGKAEVAAHERTIPEAQHAPEWIHRSVESCLLFDPACACMNLWLTCIHGLTWMDCRKSSLDRPSLLSNPADFV